MQRAHEKELCGADFAQCLYPKRSVPMFRLKFMIPALSVACLVASQAVVPTMAMASPLKTVPSIHASYGKHMVNLNLANSTGATLEVKVGDTPMSIEAGKTV